MKLRLKLKGCGLGEMSVTELIKNQVTVMKEAQD